MSSMTARLPALGAGWLLTAAMATPALAETAGAQAEGRPEAEALEATEFEGDALDEVVEGKPVPPEDEGAEEAAAEETAAEETAAEEEQALLEAVEEDDAGGDATDDLPALEEAEETADAIPDGEIEGFERSPSERGAEQRAQTLFDQARSHMQAGEVGDAARTLRRAVNLHPEFHDARQAYARIMVATGRPGHAREILRAGLERAPGHVAMARLYAALATEAGDLASAAAALERVSEGREEPALAARGQLAEIYRDAGQYERAIEHYQALAEAEPEQGRWRVGRAVALEEQGDPEAALEAWRHTLEARHLDKALERYARSRIVELQRRVE